jgi:hypothetical protein
VPAAGRPLLRGGAIALTAAYALVAASTTPFSTAADVVTALPILALVVAAVVRWPLHSAPAPLVAEPGARFHHPYRAWVWLLVVVVAWEFYEYLARGSRASHPTLSSMTDALDRHYLLKAAIFFGWLWLGMVVVREGARARVRGSRRGGSASDPGPAQ